MANIEDYIERIGLFPSYGTPEQIDEDEEFKYYLFKVPRHYIRMHIAEGGTWIDYEEIEQEGTLDKSVVLGIRYLPVYVGIEFVDYDEDYVNYKCRVPKALLDTVIEGTNPQVTYEYAYYQVEEWEKTEEQKLDEELMTTFTPNAGDEMPDRSDLTAIRKVKKEKVLLYEIIFKCMNTETCGVKQSPHISSDFFDALYEQECEFCGCRQLELISSKAIIKEEEDDGEG